MESLKKFYRYLSAKISAYFKLFFVLLFIGLLLNIYSSLSLRLSYPSPKIMTCAQFYQNPVSPAWLKLEDCNIDTDNVMTVSKTHLGVTVIKSIVIPVFPNGVKGDIASAKLFIKNNDPELLKKLSDEFQQPSEQLESMFTNLLIQYMASELTGLVLDTEKIEVTDSAGKTKEIDSYPFQDDAKPTWPVTEILWAFAVLAIISVWVSWKKRKVVQ